MAPVQGMFARQTRGKGARLPSSKPAALQSAAARKLLHVHVASPARRTTASLTTRAREGNELVEKAVEGLVAAAAASTTAAGTEFQGRVESAKVQAEVDALAQLAARLGVDRVDRNANDGDFRGVLTTDMRQIDTNNVTTLGRLSFNKILPVDLKIQLEDAEGKALTGLPDQVKGLYEGVPQAYVVHSHFKILPVQASPNSSFVPEDALHGVFSAVGVYDIPGEEQPQRLGVTFRKLVLRPADKNRLAAWLEALAPHNPSMRQEDGVLEIMMPASAPKGALDYMLMTPEWHISKGNLGSIVAMRRA